MTQLQKAMIREIQESEKDGIGMGYSEFDGKNLTPEQKGVLGSLVAEGYVYNSFEGQEGCDAMYCTTMFNLKKTREMNQMKMNERTFTAVVDWAERIQMMTQENSLINAQYIVHDVFGMLRDDEHFLPRL